VGCIGTREIAAIPRGEWPRRTVGAIACECRQENTIDPAEDAVHAFTRMTRHQVGHLLAVESG
jgi:hypothetical protein